MCVYCIVNSLKYIKICYDNLFAIKFTFDCLKKMVMSFSDVNNDDKLVCIQLF